MALYRNETLDNRIVEGPEEAQAMLAPGGWVKLNKKDTEAYYADQRQAELDLEAKMTSSAEIDPGLVVPAETGSLADGTTEKGK